MLDKQQRAAKEFAPLQKLFEQTKTLNLDYTKAKIRLAEAEQAIDRAVTGASDLMKRVDDAEEWTRKNLKLVAELESRFSTSTVKVAKVATEFVTACASFVAGSWSDPQGTVASLKGASLSASIGLANDSVQAAHDAHAALKKKSGA